jgi:signal transduction histidine kinase
LGAPSQDKVKHALLCLTHPLSGGGMVALQWGASPEDLAEPSRWAALSLPLLMWAVEAAERRAIEAQSAKPPSGGGALPRSAPQTKDEEREWLAYELHDRVAGPLVGALQLLQGMEAAGLSPLETAPSLLRSRSLLAEAALETRALMHELRAPTEPSTPWKASANFALAEEELRLLKETGCRVRRSWSAAVPLSEELDTALSRILREALLNIRRHAAARHVAVSLRCDGAGARLLVRDDGVGFDPAAVLAQGRLGGLLSIRRRAELLGGTCQLESKPGRGTRVQVWVPLHSGKSQIPSKELTTF